MAVTADSVVVELVAKTDGYTAAVRGAGSVTDTAMTGIERSASKAEGALVRLGENGQRSAGQIANATRNLGRQVADIGVGLSSGQSPFLILAQQAPQVADALADTGGKAAQVAAFFAGPWGAALLAAGSALGVLLGKALETGDSVDDLVGKLTEQARKAELSSQADRIFAGTQAGLSAKIRETTAALAAQNASLRTNAQLRNVQARSEAAAAEASVSRAGQNLASAQRRLAQLSTPGSSDARLAGARDEVRAAQQAAQQAVQRAQQEAAEANRNLNVSRVYLASENAIANSTTAGRITKQYDDQIKAIQREAVAAARAGRQIGNVTQQRIEGLERQKNAALEAASASDKASGGGTRARGRSAVRSRAMSTAAVEPFVFNSDLLNNDAAFEKLIENARRAGERAAEAFRETFGKEGADYADPFAGVTDYNKQIAAETDARQQAGDELARRQEDQVRGLAGIYESAFTAGSSRGLENFKREALRTIALLLAQATVASFSKGGGGFGSLLSNIGSAASSIFSGTPGRASGGYVGPGQTVRVNEGRGSGVELLRMGSQGGTVIPLGQAAAAPRGGGNRTFQISVDARNSVTPAGFADQLSRSILSQAAQMDDQAGRETLRQAPGYVRTSQRFGAPKTI